MFDRITAAAYKFVKGFVISAGEKTALRNSISAAATSTAINTSNSLQGGGSLASTRTLSLVGDNATPGNNKLYGTGNTGTKGWHDIPVISVAGKTGAVALEVADISGAVADSRTVGTEHSLQGGGALTGNLILSLVNDEAAPGNTKFYGTDGSGVKGWYSFPSGGSVAWDDITSKPATFPPTIGATSTTAVAGNDPRLTNARDWTAATIAQAEAETGTATTRRAFTAQRVRQAIVAWWATVSANYSETSHTHSLTLTGNVTGTGNINGTIDTTIADNAITETKIANASVTNGKLVSLTATIKGRIASGTGAPTDLTPSEVRTLLNIEDGANNYTLPAPTESTLGGVKRNLRASGQFVKGISVGGDLEYETPGGGADPSTDATAISVAHASGTLLLNQSNKSIGAGGRIIDVTSTDAINAEVVTADTDVGDQWFITQQGAGVITVDESGTSRVVVGKPKTAGQYESIHIRVIPGGAGTEGALVTGGVE